MSDLHALCTPEVADFASRYVDGATSAMAEMIDDTGAGPAIALAAAAEAAA